MRSMHEGDYFTYIMASRKAIRSYVGVSGDLLKRVFQHKMEGARRFHREVQLRSTRLVRRDTRMS